MDELKVSLHSFSITRSDEFGIGGRLRHFIAFWRRITHDPFILNTILGARHPFTDLPRQRFAPCPYRSRNPNKQSYEPKFNNSLPLV
jgi:hypothetical protein